MLVLLLNLALYAHRQTEVPVTHLAIFSERCSGSNYIQRLIEVNSALQRNESWHKHFPPSTFENSDHTLFVIIFRNPYDWVRSFYLQPFYAHPALLNLPFSAFIRSTWWSSFERDPNSDLPFTNVLQLRKSKIETMLLLKESAKNVYYINYETARDHPQEVLAELSSLFQFPLYAVYTPRILYKNQLGVIYVPKIYDPISPEDLSFINSQLDEGLENSIGYQLKRE